MATIARVALENSASGRDPWPALVVHVRSWAAMHAVELRDAVVLVPYAQLLPLARGAFAQAGGWSPRVETTRTLSANLGPPPPHESGQLTSDAVLDALTVAQLLRTRAWGAAWSTHDPRGFEQAVDQVVSTGHELARAAAVVPPAARAAHWAAVRAALPPMAGPGERARLLARVALEWAALAPPPNTDRLFAMASPSAWIVIQAGGRDVLAGRLLESGAPGLLIDTDPPQEAPLAAAPGGPLPALAVCDGFEHEARCTAAQVLEHLRLGQTPVALVAQDRLLVRRVRALLEQQQVGLADETGWKLSTTRSAAQTMALLTAARADARIDTLFDWLHAGTRWSTQEAALAALETACRRRNVARVAGLDHVGLDEPGAALWAAARAVLRRLTATTRQPLRGWLVALADAQQRCGSWQLLTGDEAGRQVIAALHLDSTDTAAWSLATSTFTMDFGEFGTWVDRVLEQAIFRPEAGAGAQVIVTPLQQVMLRPFAALVFPGADDKQLGAWPAPHPLLGDALLAAAGLPDAAQRQLDESLAFAHALRSPQVTLLRRRVDGSEPLAASPLLERLELSFAREGRKMPAWCDPGPETTIAATPIFRSAPAAPGLLPARLSASACEALRACPYRFFALHLLRLREEDELDDEVDKRDYGTWLHAVLHAFHLARQAPAEPDLELAQLQRAAELSRLTQGLDEAEFLPFAASFAAFAPRYVAWLHARDAEGAHWLRGEASFSVDLPELAGTTLHGVIDRIDSLRSGGGQARQLIDYKTGSVIALQAKVKQPLEDTQLAFYAALAGADGVVPLQAMYLAIDGTRRIDEVEHPQVASSATALVQGIAHDFARLRAGAGMAALGEGETCEHCAARGVCRRDHWSAPAASAP